MDEKLAEYIAAKEREAQVLTDQALRAITRARVELDHIEAELVVAAANQPYRRIGQIDGVSAQAVFDAFGAIELVAQLRSIHDLTQDEAEARGLDGRDGTGTYTTDQAAR